MSTRPEIRHGYEHHHLAAHCWKDFEVRDTYYKECGGPVS